VTRPAHVRTAVEEILEGSDRHGWSVDSLADALGAAGVDASFSAVWRALQHLERVGVARRVDLGDGKVRYERTGAHHDHVQCENCGAVSAVEECVVEDAVRTVEASTGFSLSGHQLVFRGVCPACIEGASG
jgi:Fur family transcriptional regulator, peroxide stress response regulator